MSQKANYKNFRDFFFTIAKPYYGWLFAMFLVGIYAAVHSVLQPYVLKILLDSSSSAGKGQVIDACLIPGILLISLGFIIILGWRFYNYTVLKSMPRLKADIIKITTSHLRERSFNFFQDQLVGSIGAKISDLTGNIESIVSYWFEIFRQSLTIALSIATAGMVNKYFSLIFFAISSAFVVIAYYCSNNIKPYANAYAEAETKNSGNIVDSFYNVLNMLLFSRENYEADYLDKNTAIAVEKDRSMQFKSMLNASLLGAFTWLLLGSSVVLLLYLGDQGSISIGDFALIFILSITIIDQILYLTDSLLVVNKQIGICDQAVKTIFKEHHQKNLSTNSALNITNGEIVLSNVEFGYSSDSPVVKGLNMHIPGNSRVGLVGHSGAGKSTVVQLITRLLDVDEGDILIDGQNIRFISRQSVCEKIAFIPQSPSLFNRSIFENILYGNINASYEDVIEASKKAHAHEFISKLPNGYDSIVGGNSLKLSGGECQRIAIARAILKDAPILILDEATSSLDSLTEKLIQESLHIAMQNRTVIVIAHRLSTILSMDNIFVIANGMIVEEGTHQQLIKNDGFYKSLYDSSFQ